MTAQAVQSWAEVLTTLEAAHFLRLDVDHEGDEAAATRAVLHLVAKHGLRPVRGCGKQHRFTLIELRRWVQHATETGDPQN